MVLDAESYSLHVVRNRHVFGIEEQPSFSYSVVFASNQCDHRNAVSPDAISRAPSELLRGSALTYHFQNKLFS